MEAAANLAVARWTANRDLLSSCSSQKHRQITAVLLENQRKCEYGDIVRELSRDEKLAMLNVVLRVWGRSEMVSLFSVQPLLGESGLVVYHDENGGAVIESVDARVSKLKAAWAVEALGDIIPANGIDPMTEITCIISLEIGLEMGRLLLRRAREISAAQTQVQYGDFRRDPTSIIRGMHDMIEGNLGREANTWVVMSPEAASVIESTGGLDCESYNADNFGLGLQKACTLEGKWDIYKDPLVQPGTIQMGHHGVNEPGDSGLIYAPYRLDLVKPDPGSFNPMLRIVSRDCLCEAPNAGAYYATGLIDGFGG